MKRLRHRIGILGSGFGGSLTGLILESLGWDVVIIDRQVHPRFAIGESSTPIADRILGDLCQRYGLGEVSQLCRYGTATKHRERYLVGPKRGFSYFFHPTDQPFVADDGHNNEMLVAASGALESADTHWHRATVDHYLAQRAMDQDVPVLQGVDILAVSLEKSGTWRIAGRWRDAPVEIVVDFLIDASGRGSPLARACGIGDVSEQLVTDTGAVYGHFESLLPVHNWYTAAGGDLDQHPFPCDQAAVHQVTPTGWMWQLRFDNDLTSAGWCLPSGDLPSSDDELARWWLRRNSEYPTLKEQFRTARLVAPPTGLQRVRRMQFMRTRAAGDNWAMLPSSFGFIDPLHSSGIAHSMAAVEKLSRLFQRSPTALPETSDLADYSNQLRQETLWIDRLVSGCYAALPNFQLFRLFSMWYFLAAIHYENRRAQCIEQPGLFLAADDSPLQSLVSRYHARLQVDRRDSASPQAIADLQVEYRAAMEPYNVAGLLSPESHPFYAHTKAPGK